MTHTEIASSIRNRVSDGLSGNIGDQAFSIEQLMDEIDLTRAEIINKLAMAGKVDVSYLLQSIDTIPIEMLSPSDGCVALDGPCSEIAAIKVPKLMSVFGSRGIQYLGLTNMQESIAAYFHPEDIRNHKVRIRTSQRPFAWIDTTADANDMFTLFLFNLGKYNALKYLKLRAVFDNPNKVGSLDPNNQYKEYAAPGHIQLNIIDILTEKYVRYYRQLNIPNITNTQTDQVT